MATGAEIEAWKHDLNIWARHLELIEENCRWLLVQDLPYEVAARTQNRLDEAVRMASRLRAEAAEWAQLLLERPHWLP